MTDFQRAVAGVEALEGLILQLRGAEEGKETMGLSMEPAELSTASFLFEPPPRREPSFTGEEWEVVGTVSAFQGQVSQELCALFAESQLRFCELGPVVEKMQRRCQIRFDLEALKEELVAQLSLGRSPESDEATSDAEEFGGDKEVLRAAQAALEAERAAFGGLTDDLQAVLKRAKDLEGAATYGAKMAERAFDLVARFGAARALFDTDVVPRLGAAVAAEAADEAERSAAEAENRQAALEEEARYAREEMLRPVAQLLVAVERAAAERVECKPGRDTVEHGFLFVSSVVLDPPRSCGAALRGSRGLSMYS